jgi:hypothetical protein
MPHDVFDDKCAKTCGSAVGATGRINRVAEGSALSGSQQSRDFL